MKLFLTGTRGIGKSTVIDRTLALLELIPGGFRTCYDDKRAPDKTLRMISADRSRSRLAVRFSDGHPQLFPETFERFGVSLLEEGLSAPQSLLLMDELGFFEERFPDFQAAVGRALDAPIPVLGVLRLTTEPCWLDRIRSRADVTLITVTEENRDALPGQLAALLRDAPQTRK